MKLGHTGRWLLQTMYSGGLNSFAAMEIPPEQQPTLGSKTTFVAQQPRTPLPGPNMLNKKLPLILQMQTSDFFLGGSMKFQGEESIYVFEGSTRNPLSELFIWHHWCQWSWSWRIFKVFNKIFPKSVNNQISYLAHVLQFQIDLPDKNKFLYLKPNFGDLLFGVK